MYAVHLLSAADGDIPLHNAAYGGEVGTLQSLLDGKANIQVQDEDGDSALHKAVHGGEVASIQMLLKAKADIQAQDQDGYSALHDAAAWGKTEALTALIDAKADLEAQGKDGCTPLHRAASLDKVQSMTALLQSKARVEAVDRRGWSALHKAASLGAASAVTALLLRKADINLQSTAGLTPLDCASGKAKQLLRTELERRKPSPEPVAPKTPATPAYARPSFASPSLASADKQVSTPPPTTVVTPTAHSNADIDQSTGTPYGQPIPAYNVVPASYDLEQRKKLAEAAANKPAVVATQSGWPVAGQSAWPVSPDQVVPASFDIEQRKKLAAAAAANNSGGMASTQPQWSVAAAGQPQWPQPQVSQSPWPKPGANMTQWSQQLGDTAPGSMQLPDNLRSLVAEGKISVDQAWTVMASMAPKTSTVSPLGPAPISGPVSAVGATAASSVAPNAAGTGAGATEGTKVLAVTPSLLPDKLPDTPQSALLTMGTEPLGSGGFSKVYPATYGGVQVAVKQLDASAGLGKAREEVLAAMSVAHDNVVHIVAVSMDPNFVDSVGRQVGVCIIMEKADQDLATFVAESVKSRTPVKPVLLLSIMSKVAHAMAALHVKGVLHQDLKPSNILVAKDGNPESVRVCDFGIARSVVDEDMDVVVGTPGYQSPELLDAEDVDKPSDVYAMAMTMVSIINPALTDEGKLMGPWGVLSMADIEENVINGDRPALPKTIPSDIRQLVERTWQQDPKKRPTMAQLSEQLDALTADYTHMHPTRMTVSTTQRLIRDAPWRLPIDARVARKSALWTSLGRRVHVCKQALQLPPQSAEGRACAAVLQWVEGASPHTRATWAGGLRERMKEMVLVLRPQSESAFYFRAHDLFCRYKDSEDPRSPFHPQWKSPVFTRHGIQIQQDIASMQWRHAIVNRFQDAKCYPTRGKPTIPGNSNSELARQLAASPVAVRIAFHATPSMSVAESIFQSNFADLCTVDRGFFGCGTYFSMDLPYVLTHYAKRDPTDNLCTVLVCAVLVGSAYPVLENPFAKDGSSLMGMPCVPKYDAHVSLVDGSTVAPVPMPPQHWPKCQKLYSELVVFENSQVLPIAVLRFA